MGKLTALPSARSLAVILSTCIAVCLLFGVLFIQARSDLTIRRQQADFGEVARIVHQLRDLGDVVVERASPEGRKNKIEESWPEPFQVEATTPAPRSWCRQLPGNGRELRLSLEGTQARDRKLALTAVDSGDGGYCVRTFAQSVLDGAPNGAGSRDLALEGPDGRILLVLRGDGGWSDQPLASRTTQGAQKQSGDAGEGGKAAPASDQREGGVISVLSGGRERQLYQWPLDLGRPVKIMNEGGTVTCEPRQCRLSALGSEPGPGAVMNNLSPFTKAMFGLAVILLLLLVPLIKLGSIDPNASLTWLDVIAIMAAVPLMVATLVTASAVIAFWTDMRRDNDHMARSLAAAIAQDIDREVGRSLKVTEQVATRFGGEWRARGGMAASLPPADAGGPPAEPGPFPLLVVERRKVADSLAVAASNPTSHPPIRDISTRRYFDRLRTGNMLPCASGRVQGDLFGCLPGRTYTVDLVPAANSGNSRLVILLADPGDRDHFLMAGKPPAATMGIAMPRGFGFAVIDPASLEVLQHSDRARALNESFDSQTDAWRALRRAARAIGQRCDLADRQGAGRRPGGGASGADPPPPDMAFDARYGGQRVRMTFGLACSARWLVATWYDRTSAENMALTPAYVAGFMMLLVCVMLVIALVAMATINRNALLRRIWPNPEPVVDRAADRWLHRTLVPHAMVGMLMLAGLLIARGDALLLHGLLGLFLLIMLVARPRSDAGLRNAPFLFGLLALAGYAVTALAAVLLQWAESGRTYISAIYPFIVMALALIATDGWFGRPILKPLFVRLWPPKSHGPAAPLPSIARKLYRVVRLQALSLYLLAIIPPLAAFGAGAGHIRSEETVTNLLHICEVRARTLRTVAGLQQALYEGVPGLRAAAAPDGQDEARAQFDCPISRRAAPADLSAETMLVGQYTRSAGAPSIFAEKIIHLWSSQQPAILSQSIDFRKYRAYLNGLAKDVCGNIGQNCPPDVSRKFLIWLIDKLFIAGTVIGAGLVVYRLMLLVAYNLFGMQHFGFRTLHPRHTPCQIRAKSKGPLKAVFIDYPHRDFKALEAELQPNGLELFDLAIERSKLGDKSMAVLTAKSWIVTGFESIVANRDLRLRALGLLEQLTARPEVNVYFFAKTLPLVRLRQTREREKREAEAAGVMGVMNESESYRWAELFSDFITYTWNEPVAEPVRAHGQGDTNLERLIKLIEIEDVRKAVERWADRNPAAAAVVANEMIRIPSDQIQDQIRSFNLSEVDIKEGNLEVLNDLDNIYVEQIYEYMANFLGDYYQGEWVRCTKEEHLIMYHLAHRKFINTSNFPVLNSLLSRRLVKTEPNFRLMNESFGHWIRTLEHPGWFNQFRQEAEKGGTWSLLRLPLLLLVAAGSVLITYLDHDGTGSLVTLIPGVVATMPILLSRFTRPASAAPA